MLSGKIEQWPQPSSPEPSKEEEGMGPEKERGFTKEDWELVAKVESTDFGTIFWEGVGGKSYDEITDAYKRGEQVFGEKKFEEMCLKRGTEVLLVQLEEKLKTEEGKRYLAEALGIVERLKSGPKRAGKGLIFEVADSETVLKMAQTEKGKGELINAMVIYDAERRTFNREQRLERGELIKYIKEKRAKESKEQ